MSQAHSCEPCLYLEGPHRCDETCCGDEGLCSQSCECNGEHLVDCVCGHPRNEHTGYSTFCSPTFCECCREGTYEAAT